MYFFKKQIFLNFYKHCEQQNSYKKNITECNKTNRNFKTKINCNLSHHINHKKNHL